MTTRNRNHNRIRFIGASLGALALWGALAGATAADEGSMLTQMQAQDSGATAWMHVHSSPDRSRSATAANRQMAINSGSLVPLETMAPLYHGLR